nr:acylneuraminate cytidylyltransferase family protein [uncultured Allomuricauda sp.]
MKPLVVIPARGGSKGIPGKNIKMLNGKPLIQYTIEAAMKVFKNSEICLSTDSSEIREVAENLGLKVPFLRPAELATDTATTYDVLLNALDFYEKNGLHPDAVILLQPTSPLRNSQHIKDALKEYSFDYDMLVSVTETKSNPYYVLFEENQNGWLKKSKKGKFTRRQDCPKVWEFNGAIYVIKTNSLKKGDFTTFEKIKKYVMDAALSIDLDDTLDWKICEFLLKEKIVTL